jgi:hypothetical protein
MNMKPASEEARNAVWAAYEALSEKQKRAIVKHTAKSTPKNWRYWVRQADCMRGCDQRKVAGRDGAYGPKLDKALKECEDGGLAADIFAMFLMETGIVDVVMKGIPESASEEEIARLVDEKAAASDSEYAAFAAAFVKCYPPHRKRTSSPADKAEKEMSGLVARLDDYATKFEGWASALRLTGSVPGDDVSAAVEAANADASRLAELMRGHRESTGCAEKEFKTPDDVAAHVKELSEALAASHKSDEIEDFLRSLANALRSLNVTHRSAAERTRLSELRDGAAAEVEGAADSDEPKWAHGTDDDGAGWLRWAFEIDAKELETTQDELKAGGYERLSEFIGVGKTGWIPEEPGPAGDKPETKARETGEEKQGPAETKDDSGPEKAAAKSVPGEPVKPVEKKESPKPVETKKLEKAEEKAKPEPAAPPAKETQQKKAADTKAEATPKPEVNKEQAPEAKAK